MSTTQLRSTPGTGRLAARVVRAEWTRVVTVRTTWWCLLATAVTVVGMATLLAMDVTSDQAAGRRTLLLARTAVTTATAVAAGVLLVVAADVVAWAIAPVLELSAPDLVRSLARVTAVVAAGALLAAGLGFLLRSTAGALASVFLLVLVLPLVLPAFGVAWLSTVGIHTPGGAALHLLGEEAAELSTTTAVLVLAAWPAAATAAGAASFLLRDAD